MCVFLCFLTYFAAHLLRHNLDVTPFSLFQSEITSAACCVPGAFLIKILLNNSESLSQPPHPPRTLSLSLSLSHSTGRHERSQFLFLAFSRLSLFSEWVYEFCEWCGALLLSLSSSSAFSACFYPHFQLHPPLRYEFSLLLRHNSTVVWRTSSCLDCSSNWVRWIRASLLPQTFNCLAS